MSRVKFFNVLAPLFLPLLMFAQERAEWMPEEAAGGYESEGGERIQLPVTLTKLPKKTADGFPVFPQVCHRHSKIQYI